MNELHDTQLDGMLATLRVKPPQGDFAQRLMQLCNQPQRRGLRESAAFLLAELAHEIFGSMADSPAYNTKWRLSGALAALVVGFSIGYSTLPVSDEEGDALFADQYQEVGVL
jgi:hypothetical protein